uniref:Uncharacterized protein n=1 Tax=Arundo donax TaxID=35708 RepID=A0A0A9B7G2_ARUDO
MFDWSFFMRDCESPSAAVFVIDGQEPL